MSLLLDALKKSEAQRRRGKAPAIDLASTPPSISRRRPGLRWLVILLAGVVLVAAAPWLWPQISSLVERRQVADTEAGESDRAGAEHATTVAATDQLDARSPSLDGSNQAGNPAPTAESQRPAEPAPVAGAANARLAASTEAADDAEPGGAMLPDELAESPASDDGGSEAASAPGRVQQPQTPEQTRQVQEPEPESAPEPEPEPRENFIRPWDLPQAQRSEFPDLDLTVHFYADQPANRFVLINGERYTEGQLVEPGTRLSEIRQRGAVVEFGSYRVLIE